ncbi:XRE family transcriptional regulator [Burkholderia multivorans]|nr:XRE family transcriptional regulator [Burkholderia multivorans]QET38874.1 XRE family transcriptional regulator [Burkholderia multivorans]
MAIRRAAHAVQRRARQREENGGRADLWLAQQSAYDPWQARAKGAPKVARAQART